MSANIPVINNIIPILITITFALDSFLIKEQNIKIIPKLIPTISIINSNILLLSLFLKSALKTKPVIKIINDNNNNIFKYSGILNNESIFGYKVSLITINRPRHKEPSKVINKERIDRLYFIFYIL